ncbi:MAG: hypothetical protein JKX71_15575 [Amylibacter sp.]|nr:hypothetical protein [Amylibacter sp.]
MVEVSNEDEFEEWLKGQNQPVHIAIATRAALRSFPVAIVAIADKKEQLHTKTLSLLTGRAILTSAVVCNAPTDDVKAAARSSADSITDYTVFPVNDSIFSVISAAASAASAADSTANYAKFAISAAISTTDSASRLASFSDANIIDLDITTNLLQSPLWRNGKFDGIFKVTWDKFVDEILPNAPEFNFWRDWYQGFLDGKPLDWNLQREVALIPDADWDKGPAHIADMIEEIKAQFLADKAPLAEKLELNPETGKFFVTPIPARKPDLLNTTLEKTADALDDALNGRNGLSADDRVARVLRRCFEKYTHNPERIEMDFVDVHAGLTRQMASGELADSEEILSLAEVLKNGALDIRANHSDIAANRETRAAQALQELTPEQKQQLKDAQPILEAITEGEVLQDMGADIPALINDMIGPVPDYAPPVGPAVRVVNRAAKMSLMMRMKDFDIKLVEKCGYKSLEIFGALLAVIGIGLGVFGLF